MHREIANSSCTTPLEKKKGSESKEDIHTSDIVIMTKAKTRPDQCIPIRY